MSSQSSDISVTALEDLEVLVLDPETLNVLIDEMPRLARDRRPDGHPAQGRPVGPEARRPGSLSPAPGCFWSEPVRAPRCPRSRQRAAPAHSNDWRSGGEDATGWCGVPPKEGLLPAVPPLRDVVRETRDDDTGQSGHDRRLSAAEMPVTNYVCCPRNSWRHVARGCTTAIARPARPAPRGGHCVRRTGTLSGNGRHPEPERI